MFELRKKETPVANIAFMSIMAAINVIFALLMAFIPYIMFILILILPMSSVLVALYCQKRYYPLYIIVTLGLCFVSAIWDPSITIFYILPSMITGFLFALFLIKKLPNLYLIVIPSIIQLGFNYLGLYISYLLTNVNVLETIRAMVALKDFEYYYGIVPAAMITICLIQSLFSYMIIKDELPKFKYEVNEEKESLFYANAIICLDLLTLTLIFGVIQVFSIAYLSLVLASVFAIDLMIKSCLKKSKVMIILNAVSFAVFVILFSSLYQFLPNGTSLLIFGGFYFLVTIYAIIYNCLVKREKMAKIESDIETN